MKQLNYFLGTVGSDTRSGLTDKGKRWVSFRMAVNHDYLNKDSGTFETIDTVWYEVSAFGALAENTMKSVHKGDSVFVVGRLKVREWTTEDGRSGATVGIAAEAVGFNLQFTQAFSTRQALKNADASDTEGADQAETETAAAQAHEPAGRPGFSGGASEAPQFAHAAESSQLAAAAAPNSEGSAGTADPF